MVLLAEATNAFTEACGGILAVTPPNVAGIPIAAVTEPINVETCACAP